jgi:hypothetical protein
MRMNYCFDPNKIIWNVFRPRRNIELIGFKLFFKHHYLTIINDLQYFKQFKSNGLPTRRDYKYSGRRLKGSRQDDNINS